MKSIQLFSRFSAITSIKQEDNILLLTHTDLDGSGSAIILKSIFPNITIKHCYNSSMSNDIVSALTDKNIAEKYNWIFACDISCTLEDAELVEVSPYRNKFFLLDHHSSASCLSGFAWACIFSKLLEDTSLADEYGKSAAHGHSSGTLLLYELLNHFGIIEKYADNFKGSLKQMTFLISAYDTWDWNTIFGGDKKFSDFNSLLDIYGVDIFERLMLERIKSNSPLLAEMDYLMLEADENKRRDFYTRLQKIVHTGVLKFDKKEYRIAFCFTSERIADTFAYMKETYPDVDLYLINSGTSVSLRSTRSDVDCAAIAKNLKGGGHPGAGGFSFSVMAQAVFLKQLMHASWISVDYWKDTAKLEKNSKDAD